MFWVNVAIAVAAAGLLALQAFVLLVIVVELAINKED